jgi:hypothetical protein
MKTPFSAGTKPSPGNTFLEYLKNLPSSLPAIDYKTQITRVRQQIPIFPVFANPTLTKSSTYS